MRLAFLSDVHLDHVTDEATEALALSVIEAGCDAAIITGDISTSKRLKEDLETFADALDGLPTYFVLGNHDIWHGSFAKVHASVAKWSNNRTRWLEMPGVVILGESTALIGVDGWYDGGCGDIYNTNVMMNDWPLIRELKVLDTVGGEWGRFNGVATPLRHKLLQLGTESSAKLMGRIQRTIAAGYGHILIATHVPPFHECSLYAGQPSGTQFAPFYINKSLGDSLCRLAIEHPSIQFTVLAGHTHHKADVQIADNLRCHVAHAEYGRPAIAGFVEVTANGVEVTHV